MLESDGVKSKS